ncbi:MAG: hypothetical protein RQ729_09700 [Wenzhouxiangellaceae bacterium]|nr:hypothetical protein [Wenzhouxiangellaceae bacterium]
MFNRAIVNYSLNYISSLYGYPDMFISAAFGKKSPCRHAFALALIGLTLAAPGMAEDGDDEPHKLRVAAVNAPVQSGLLADLLTRFTKETGIPVVIHGSSDPYGRARSGQADLVLSHYGKAAVEPFVKEGLGLWPRLVFANRMALIGPRSDPAGVADIADPLEAIQRMAEHGATLLVGPNPGSRYLAQLLLVAAGDGAQNLQFEQVSLMRGQLMREAERRSAYTLWGAFPFQRFQTRNDTELRMMGADSPLLHRVMAVVRVNPQHISGVNAEGAARLESWLLSPQAQAAVLAFREPGHNQPTWWPAARNNNPGMLLDGSVDAEEDF